MGPPKTVLAVLVCLFILRLSAAARTQQQQHGFIQNAATVPSTDDQTPTSRLNTYYFDAHQLQITLSSRAASRPERTAVVVQLSEVSVGKFMPVVNPKASGMTHSVSQTWKALKVCMSFPSARAVAADVPAQERLGYCRHASTVAQSATAAV